MPINYVSNGTPTQEASYRVSASELHQIVVWIEDINRRAAEISEERKAFMLEVKARGYDTKAVRAIVALRARDLDDVREEEAVMEMYREAMGLL